MARGLPYRGKDTVKISLIVEGQSDEIVLREQENWFELLGLEVDIHPTGGKPNMINKARKYYKAAMYTGSEKTIFLPDQDNDICAMVTRQRIGVDSLDGAITIVMKRKLEAWILADGKCIQNSIGAHYSPVGQTDREVDCKSKLLHIIRSKRGYLPTAVEAAKIIAKYFSIARAARNNTSVRRFKEFVEGISQDNAN